MYLSNLYPMHPGFRDKPVCFMFIVNLRCVVNLSLKHPRIRDGIVLHVSSLCRGHFGVSRRMRSQI